MPSMTHPDILRAMATGESNRCGPAAIATGEVELTITVPVEIAYDAECSDEDAMRMHAVELGNRWLGRARRRGFTFFEDAEIADARVSDGPHYAEDPCLT